MATAASGAAAHGPDPARTRRLGGGERFSNTVQFSDNLTKMYKSHTFKGGYMSQGIFFGSTQPPYARGEYYWDGRYTSLVNATDNSTSARTSC